MKWLFWSGTATRMWSLLADKNIKWLFEITLGYLKAIYFEPSICIVPAELNGVPYNQMGLFFFREYHNL